MTNSQQILEKAIQKAMDNGWRSPLPRAEMLASYIDGGDDYYQLEPLIYNHDFAKALWGEEPAYGWSGDVVPKKPDETAEPLWQYHLQRMVIADDPIEYLGENI